MKIQLRQICHARSGDKGDTGNVGLIARKPEYYPLMEKYVTADAVKKHFEGICAGNVDRYPIPNLNAINFLLHVITSYSIHYTKLYECPRNAFSPHPR